MAYPLFNVVLYQPQIPNNTGNIGRTTMATGCRLHIIRPIGFEMNEKACRRAGLDYWEFVDCVVHETWDSFLADEKPARMWLFTTQSGKPFWEAEFNEGDYLLFGQENGGVPPELHHQLANRFGPGTLLQLPMVDHERARSLNLATAAAVGIYEGMRQVRCR
ncbi:MAG: tRNA (cytidine(34)-2'-O)-methyltransferase [Phycisphaerales bacterium]|nr:tRNA (cytidine(34)-2'-O)-methyltransferase [Phycisphaerales bacterium]